MGRGLLIFVNIATNDKQIVFSPLSVNTLSVTVDVSGVTEMGNSEVITASVISTTAVDEFGKSVNVKGTVRGNVITVNNPPLTVNVTASPMSVPYDGSTTISWSSPNATSCTLDSSPQLLTPSSSLLMDRLATSTMYYFTCRNGNKFGSSTVNVNVEPWMPPPGYKLLPIGQCTRFTAPCATGPNGLFCEKNGVCGEKMM